MCTKCEKNRKKYSHTWKGTGLAIPRLLKGSGLPDPRSTLSHFSYNKYMAVALVVGPRGPPLWFPLEMIFGQKFNLLSYI